MSGEDTSTRKGCCGGAKGCCCCRVEWAMWANMNALYASVIMFIGGVVGATVETIQFGSPIPHNFGTVTRWIVIVLAAVIFFVEYPRSARRNNKKHVERPGQDYIAPLIRFTFFMKFYFIRFIIYMVAIIPCVFVLSTIMGGLCLFFAAVCYFVAALNGEEWKAPSLAWGPGRTKKEEPQAGHTLPDAPTHPPPRPPPQHKQPTSAPPTAPPPRPNVEIELR